MIVVIEVLPWLSELAGGTVSRKVVLEIDVPIGITLREVLTLLHERHEPLGTMVFDSRRDDLTGHAELAVNGRLCDHTGGLDSVLSDGDMVSILPGIAGG